MKWKAFVALAIVVTGLFGGLRIETVKAQITFTETYIASGWYPAIYGDIIVYWDFRPWYGIGIYMYDISTGIETQITTNTVSGAREVAIYGDIIVWAGVINPDMPNADIYMYDISTGVETQITTNPADQVRPKIYGNIIVWTDERNADMTDYMPNTDIYMYDISTGVETQITTNPGYQAGPAVYGDIIAWTDHRNGNMDIYMYDLSTGTETQITTNPGYQAGPVVYGDIIVWDDWRNVNWDIYMYDLSTGVETQITTLLDHQRNPAVYGDIIAWTDERASQYNLDIYMYDLSTGVETQVTTNPYNQGYPVVIYGNKIVYMDTRYGNNNDLFMVEISFVPQPTPPTEQAENIKNIVTDPSNIPRSDFDGATDKVKDNRRKALINRLEAVIIDIQTAEASSDQSTINTAYQSAIDQLNSILDKTDGCSERGTPDTEGSGYTPDWIITSESQVLIDPLIRDLITTLEALLIP